MNIFLIIIPIMVILLVFIIIMVIKKLVKWVFFSAIIFLLLFILTGGAITNDFNMLRQKIENSSNIVLLENNGSILTGLIESRNVTFLSSNELEAIQISFNQNNFSDIRKNNGKLFIIKLKVISRLQKLEINNKQVSWQEVNDFYLRNKNVGSITYEDLILDPKISWNNRNMRAALFSYIYISDIKITKSPIFFFENYRNMYIIVYPDTIFFKFTKIIPLNWIDEKINKLKDSNNSKEV
jgi:hypothetical protein